MAPSLTRLRIHSLLLQPALKTRDFVHEHLKFIAAEHKATPGNRVCRVSEPMRKKNQRKRNSNSRGRQPMRRRNWWKPLTEGAT